MVSTRQMSTSSGGGSGVNSGGSNIGNGGAHMISSNTNHHIVESARLFPITRQNSTDFEEQAISDSSSSLMLAIASNGKSTSTIQSNNIIANRQTPLNLLDLPMEILAEILSYVSYKTVGQLRIISKKFNNVCMFILNTTFNELIELTNHRFILIKSQMPRRESARRNHHLACECDIIETCNMRLSLLHMSFGKHIERGHCCFFPAAILDEIYSIFHLIKNTPQLERPFRVTDELFDLSTMAIEYFRDRIETTLPNLSIFNKSYFKLNTNVKRAPSSDFSDNQSSLPSPPQSNMVLRKGIRKIKEGMKIYNNQLSVLRNELRGCKRKSLEQGKQITEQQKLLAEQQKQTIEYANRLDENDKKNEEMARKFSTLLQELNKCKTELQYWRSKSPAIPTCASCGQKVIPTLPQEDYQALINQGVKPEDIILNINDDTDNDTESELNFINHNSNCNFAYPDEATTSKLLAINTATRNTNKRQYSAVSVMTPPTIMPSSSSLNTSNQDHILMETNDISHTNNIIQQVEKETLVNNLNNTKCIASDTTLERSILNSGYSTKLFYGTNSEHKSVIVTPFMLAAPQPSSSSSTTNINATITTAAAVYDDNCQTNIIKTDDLLQNVEDVLTLQAVTTHETKKARRVQKATRCFNTSGKRSK